MSEKYVSTRIKAVGSAKAVQGLMHDTRFTVPGYLRRAPEVKFHSFDENFTIGFNGEKNDEIKNYCRSSIMDSVREQQAVYKEKVGQKADLEGNWAITGIITFSAGSINGVAHDKLLELGKKQFKRSPQSLE